MMNGIGLDDSIPLLWAYDSESGSTMVGNLSGHWERFRIARNNCNNLASNAKIAHYSTVSENIRLEKAVSKNRWTLVKSLTGNDLISLTCLLFYGIYYFDV
jgi:hypothetical protein